MPVSFCARKRFDCDAYVRLLGYLGGRSIQRSEHSYLVKDGFREGISRFKHQ
jgi:hypothetical protein